MEQANWYILPISAFIPIIIGMVWYNPKVFGNKLATITGDTITPINQKLNIGKVILLYLFSLLFSYVLTLNSVHQVAIFQLFFLDPSLAEPNSEFNSFISDFMSKFSDRHRSFGHGIVHGVEASFLYGLAFLGIPALLQGKPLKQIWVHLGFVVLCGALMAGLNCAFF